MTHMRADQGEVQGAAMPVPTTYPIDSAHASIDAVRYLAGVLTGR